MNNSKSVLCGCVLMVAMCTPGWAQEKIAVPNVEGETDTGSWMVGTRITHFELLDDKRGTPFHDSFMGSITEIKAEQDYMPTKLFVQYRLVESPFWVGASYDHVRAETRDNGGTDGSVDLKGILPYVQARWENETLAVPYVELGLAFYQVDFEESEGWSNDGSRTVKLDDGAMGVEIAGGVALRVYEALSIDLYAQYMDVEDITGAYYIYGNRDGDVIFTMSHITYGLGVQYQF